MSIAELHPEDLLDREESGTLTPAEEEILRVHLAHCAACRMERTLRADFAADLDAELPLHDGALFVTGALKHAPAAQTTGDRESRPSFEGPAANDDASAPPPALLVKRPARRRMAALILIAATLTFATGAAARWSGVLPSVFGAPFSVEPAVIPANVPSPVEAPRAAPHANAAPVESTPAVEASATPVDSALPEAPKVAAAPPLDLHAGPSHAVTFTAPSPKAAPSADPPVVLPPPVALPPSTVAPQMAEPAPERTASSLFADATDARRRGDRAAAMRLYSDLLNKHPNAAEANATRLALGRLSLDNGDSGRALVLFDQYLGSGEGTLREEAMAGRARALQNLGRETEERAAWNTLLQSYPQTIHRERAMARLEHR